MDKLQLVKVLMGLNPQLQAKEVELAVKVLLDGMSSRLAKGGRVEIRGFGSFSLSLVQSQNKRNSISCGKSKVPMKFVPQFKAAKELRERVGGWEEQKEASTALKYTPVSGPLNAVVPSHTQFQQPGV